MKYFIFIVVLVLSTALSAQVSLGLVGGVNTIDITSSQVKVPTSQVKDSLRIAVVDADYGFHFGAFARFQKSSFYMQPEFILTSNKTNYKINATKTLTTIDTLRSERFLSLDIPVMFGLKISILRINVGPVMHIALNNNSELKGLDGFKSNYKGATYGYQAGIGFDFSKLSFDVRHEGNFSKYGDHITFFDEKFAFDKKATRLVASLSYKLYSSR